MNSKGSLGDWIQTNNKYKVFYSWNKGILMDFIKIEEKNIVFFYMISLTYFVPTRENTHGKLTKTNFGLMVYFIKKNYDNPSFNSTF